MTYQKGRYPIFTNTLHMEEDEAMIEKEPSQLDMIRVPQLRTSDGRYISSQERHEDAIRRKLTVIVNRAAALDCQLPYVCHTMEEYNRADPLDKTGNPTPFTSLLDEEEVATYYETVSSLEQMVPRASLSAEELAQYEKLEKLDRRVWQNHISESEYQRRVAREAKLASKEAAIVACRVAHSNLEQMTSDEIARYLSHHVRNHQRIILEIAHMLSQLNNPIQPATDRFIKMVFCGSNGVGKTELIRHIAQLCRMQPGGEYDACHITIDFATCLEKGHANIITGPGPGYLGCDEPCLVDHLCNALDFLNEKEKQLEAAEEQRRYNDPQKKHRRFKAIMLEINEMDKGTLSIFTALNGLLSTGRVKSHRNRTFVLPPDVFLIMCACSNFASEYFCSLPAYSAHNYALAQSKIAESMIEKGLKPWDIDRIGVPLPFFPIEVNDAREILRFKLHELIAQNGLYIERIRMSMSMSEATQEGFIDHIIDTLYNKTVGIRRIVEHMKRELAFNLTTQREFLERHLDEAIPVPLAKRPILTFQCIPYHSTTRTTKLTMASIARDAHLGMRDRSHGLNESNLAECLAQQCDIAYFVLDCSAITKKNVIGVHVLSPMPNENDQSSPLSTKRKPERHEQQEEDDDDEGDHTTIRPKKKRRVNKPVPTETMQEEMDPIDDNVMIGPMNDIIEEPIVVQNNNENHRDNEMRNDDLFDEAAITTATEEGEDDDDDVEVRRVAATIHGRPRRAYDGFEYYDTQNKRSRYRCTNTECRAIVENRRIAKHQCKKK